MKFAAPVESEANGLNVGEQPHLLTRNRGREPPSPARSTPGAEWPDGYEHSPVKQLPSEENLYPVPAIVFWL
jgi:hypothetical protein